MDDAGCLRPASKRWRFQGAMRTYYLTPKMSKIMMMTPTTNAQLGI
jgi:hypothetical protein